MGYQRVLGRWQVCLNPLEMLYAAFPMADPIRVMYPAWIIKYRDKDVQSNNYLPNDRNFMHLAMT
jgi:hypothetical protein